ncbi:hypothetical protein IMSAGC019_03979 [Lachnospiraceae bacterium]|nr:hypothetical protein IMSAGC019_03979 [Lachnospiraceae bacterium]
MEFQVVQVSSLEKLRGDSISQMNEVHEKTVLAGERLSYQVGVRSDRRMEAEVSVESELSDYVKLFFVKNAVMDLTTTERDMEGEDYITFEPGLMPDILVPAKEQNSQLTIFNEISTIWVRVDIPENITPGEYEIKIKVAFKNVWTPECPMSWAGQVMRVHVIPAVLPKQKLIYTRWFYADCIAVQHQVEVYSEKHWELIDQYIAAAVDGGMNMILVPVHTPPLDTAEGTVRPCVQLVDIKKDGSKYEFSFEKFRRFVGICKKNGIEYFEIAHMFSQWGAKYAANIMVEENGKKEYLFGWHVAANSAEYIEFLKQYIGAISQELANEGISEKTYFHISDEPTLDAIETYKTASDIIRPLIGESKTFDALSKYDFYEKGLVACPVTSVSHIREFLEHKVENQWCYYCCADERVVTNSFLAMPSHRTRVLGFLLYKYDIKGFLHWGYNFYNGRLSRYPVNPYLTTSGDGAFPSGDPFIVYPGKDTVYTSIRGEVFYDAIQDMDICIALEHHIGREAVVSMIDSAAGKELKFDDYPKNKKFLEELRDLMVKKLKES